MFTCVKYPRRSAHKTFIDLLHLSSGYPDLKDPSKVWTSSAERTELSAKSFINGLAISNVTQLVCEFETIKDI
jgi:hypothetical protein